MFLTSLSNRHPAVIRDEQREVGAQGYDQFDDEVKRNFSFLSLILHFAYRSGYPSCNTYGLLPLKLFLRSINLSQCSWGVLGVVIIAEIRSMIPYPL